MIKEIENEIIILSCELKKGILSQEEKNLINLKLLSLYFKYGELLQNDPSYEVGEAPELHIAKGITIPLQFITIQDNKIIISQGYKDLLEQQKQFKNVKNL